MTHAAMGGVELQPSSTLVERAIACLSEGPMTTAALGERVLALRGNPPAAAAAVFALLGADARFQVDRAGTWSLAGALAPATAATLRAEEWIVVDVETTGGSPAHGHRVIEVAAVRVSGGRIAGHFTTLVNPGRPIPRMITSLTGIGDGDVSDAPRFHEIAPRLGDALRGRIFVGHNASFDWRFLCAEMEAATGHTLAGRTFCTLRVARRILPHLPSRSLGALADYFGIEMASHHRALDDAVATAHLLLGFLDTLEEREVTDWTGLERFFQARQPRQRRTLRPRSIDRE